MSHVFGDLLSQYRGRKHGLSQAKLAQSAGLDPTILGRMAQGKKDLTGPSGRDRVLRIIEALHTQGAIATQEEANALLASASFPPLFAGQPAEALLMNRLMPAAAAWAVDRKSFSTRSAPRHNLPEPLTSLIGRDGALVELHERLPNTRLLTLIGPGGCGKTQLALAFARQLLDRYPDGVWLAELATVRGAGVLNRLMSVLGLVEEEEGSSLEILGEYLRPLQSLIVLDNCEHIIDATAQVTEYLLRTCPGIQIMATSREMLNIAGEAIYAVSALAVPTAKAAQSAEMMSEFSAVRLFVERLTLARPEFRLTDQNAGPIAMICRKLDGMPLAIELAAASARVFSVEEIASRLYARFSMLTAGSRTALPRHQSLRAAIDWSYELLSEKEQTLLCRLAIFSSGWSLEAAEQVCSYQQPICGLANAPENETNASELGPADILSTLSQLVSKSLVYAKSLDAQQRYGMLETIRAYASEKLQSQGDLDRIMQRHVAYFLGLATAAEPKLLTADQVRWLDRLEVEHDNMRAALEWTTRHGRVEDGLDMAAKLTRFWYLRGHWEEARNWLSRLLEAGTQSSPRVRGRALIGLGWLANESGAELPYYQQSLALCRASGDDWGIAMSLRGIGVRASMGGDFTRGREILNESMEMFRAIGDTWGIALVSYNMGWEIGQSIDQSLELWQHSLALFEEVGDRWGQAVVLAALSYLARRRNDYDSAAVDSAHSLRLFKTLGDKVGVSGSLSTIAMVAWRRGEYRQMGQLLEESVALKRQLGSRFELGWLLGMLAMVALNCGQYARAAELADEGLREARASQSMSSLEEMLEMRGWVAFCLEDFDLAKSLCEEGLPIAQSVRDYSTVSTILCTLAQIAQRQGDSVLARSRAVEAISTAEHSRDGQILSMALHTMSAVTLAQGDKESARTYARESLVTARDLHTRSGIIEGLEQAAAVAVAMMNAVQSAQLLGCAAALRNAIGLVVYPVDRENLKAIENSALAELGQSRFEAEWQAGCQLSPAQAIKMVQQDQDIVAKG